MMGLTATASSTGDVAASSFKLLKLTKRYRTDLGGDTQLVETAHAQIVRYWVITKLNANSYLLLLFNLFLAIRVSRLTPTVFECLIAGRLPMLFDS